MPTQFARFSLPRRPRPFTSLRGAPALAHPRRVTVPTISVVVNTIWPPSLLTVPRLSLRVVGCSTRSVGQRGAERLSLASAPLRDASTTPRGGAPTKQGAAMIERRVGYAPPASSHLFHVGHLYLLRNARDVCDHLIAGVVVDELAQRVKGSRPVVPLEERLAIVANRWLRSLRGTSAAPHHRARAHAHRQRPRRGSRARTGCRCR